MNDMKFNNEAALNAAAGQAGGFVALDDLLTQAATFVPEPERQAIKDVLDDPDTAFQGVRLLRSLQREHQVNPRPEVSGPLTSRRAFKDLEQRATNGDAAAMAEYSKINPASVKWA